MSAMSERAAATDEALATLTNDELLARLPSCDCFDPECGYPHGRNRVGKLAEMRAAVADALAMHASVDISLSHARAHVASVVRLRERTHCPCSVPLTESERATGLCASCQAGADGAA